MLRVTVTGGAGFVGSHVVRSLLEHDDCLVTVLDDLSTGNQSNLPEHPRLRFLQHDVVEPWDVETDELFHLACPASPEKYQRDAVKTLHTSYLGMVNALNQAEKHGAKVVFSSTSEVYGDPEVNPQSESYWGYVNSFGPRSCYDEGKRVAESLCYAYATQRGTDVRIARIFNTYGPYMAPDDGRIVSNFIIQALQARPLTIYGEGSQTRSLCYVDDLVRGLRGLMALTRPAEGPLLTPVNLGNPHELTVREIAELILQVTSSRSTLTYLPLPKDDPRQRRPDIRRAQEVLNWKPEVDVAIGLRRTSEYFKGILAAT